MAEYVLPKFEVDIESSNKFSLSNKEIPLVIRAKYTHGKPLRGKATICIGESMWGLDYSSSCSSSGNTESEESTNILMKKIIDVDGSGEVSFNILDDLQLDTNKYYKERSYEIQAEVTEHLTGLSQSTKKKITVYKKTYDITTDVEYDGLKCESTINATVSRT